MGDPAGGGRSGELLVKREFFNAEKWMGRVKKCIRTTENTEQAINFE